LAQPAAAQPVAKEQAPAVQELPLGQLRPQAPQLVTSLPTSMQALPQQALGPPFAEKPQRVPDGVVARVQSGSGWQLP
jgi:hypothetical protein